MALPTDQDHLENCDNLGERKGLQKAKKKNLFMFVDNSEESSSHVDG